MWLSAMSTPDHKHPSIVSSEQLKDVLHQIFTPVVQVICILNEK